MTDDDAEPPAVVVPKGRCLRCNYPMTWDAQKRQYARLLKRGMTPAEIKQLLPRCQKCVTATIGRWASFGRCSQ
jgi:hypothetical protein